MKSVCDNGVRKKISNRDLKILMKIISCEANFLGMVVKLDVGVIKVNKEVDKEQKYEFQMVGMDVSSEWNECRDNKKIKNRVGMFTLVKGVRVHEIAGHVLLISGSFYIITKNGHPDEQRS